MKILKAIIIILVILLLLFIIIMGYLIYNKLSNMNIHYYNKVDQIILGNRFCIEQQNYILKQQNMILLQNKFIINYLYRRTK